MKLLPIATAGLLTGCMTAPQPPPVRPAPLAPPHHCPAQFSTHYANDALHFSLCLPAGVTKSGTTATPPAPIIFSGFPVPAGTNLRSKQLLVLPGDDPNLPGATPFGQLRAGGVTFQRAQADEGSAGHTTKHLIYTWKRSGQTVHFDFALRAVNVSVYDPADRPQEYHVAAEVQSTEEIMRTFRQLR